MAEVSMTFRGITFNTNFAGGDTYMLVDIPEGLAHPNIRSSENERQGNHGITDQNSYYGKRLITLTGRVLADTQAQRKVLERNVAAIFQLDGVQTELNASYYTLLITDEDGLAIQTEAKVETGIEFSKETGDPRRRDFIVTLKAKDPRLFSQTLDSEAIDEALTTTDFMLPTMLPVIISPVILFKETVTNDGNFATPPIITLTGESLNPEVMNNTTGQTMKLNTTLEAGDTIIIDSGLGTITKNGVDILSTLDDTSEYIFLVPGANEIELRDDTPDALELDALIEWRDAYIQI